MKEEPPPTGPGNTAPSSGHNTPDHLSGGHGGPASHAGSVGGGGDGQPNSVKQEDGVDVKPPGSVGDVKPPGSMGGGGSGGGPTNLPGGGNSDATADLFDSFDSKDGGKNERRKQTPPPLPPCSAPSLSVTFVLRFKCR